MNALDSRPFEALTINYISYSVLTTINNLWAWIAFVTAGVSFWKIRANSVSAISDHHHHSKFFTPSEEQSSISQPPCAVAAQVTSVRETKTAMKLKSRVLEECINNGGLTKGKFTSYYYGGEEVASEIKRGCKQFNHEEFDGGRLRCSHEDGCGMMLRLKTGELGWYRYQDLRVLDGNVVRLWDECGGGPTNDDYSLSGGVW